MTVTIVEAARGVTGGVDTHLDVHVAAALDPLGGLLGSRSFETSPAGFRELLGWLESFGAVSRVGVEGTGAYGAGLARFLRRAGVEVLEVDRPNRAVRRRGGKSDPLDAIEAARAVLSGRAQGQAKTRDGAVEAIRVLLVAKRSARQARGKAIMQMRHLGFTAPDQLRCQLKGLSVSALVTEGTKLGSGPACDPVTAATKASLCSLAERARTLESEIAVLDDRIGPLVRATAPDLLGLFGVGPDTAAALLVAAGDNPQRLRSEAAWAHLCGVAPIQASSGKVTRHRLDRGGNRHANAALFRIVLVRMAHDPDTKAYVERRTKEGRSKLEVIRILKRYVAREVYRHLPRR
jgi:transposase